MPVVDRFRRLGDNVYFKEGSWWLVLLLRLPKQQRHAANRGHNSDSFDAHRQKPPNFNAQTRVRLGGPTLISRLEPGG